MTPFEDLIKEFSNLMDIPLKVDPHQSCLLEFSDGIRLQIDLDKNPNRILVGCVLGELIHSGSYRESIFSQALKTNALSLNKGILAFSTQTDSLILFQFLTLSSTTGQKLFEFIEQFYAHAKLWKEALSKNEIPDLEHEQSSTISGFYGLKP